jgi:hypothetical protein
MKSKARFVRGSKILAVGLAVPFWGLIFWFAIDVVPEEPWAFWIRIVFVITGMYLLPRSIFMGVWAGESEVIVRSWFRTSRISVDRIAWVDSVSYAGFVSRGTEIPFIRSLEVHQRSGRVLTFVGPPLTPVGVKRVIVAVHAHLPDGGGNDDSPWPDARPLSG